MGNYKFRFSDMIPNAWFHKLKNMNNKPTPNYYPKTLNHSKKKPVPAPVPVNPDPQFTNSDQRKSYYFTRDLTLHPPPALPRSSSRRRRSAKRNRPALSASTVCSCGAVVRAKPEESSSAEECTNSGPDQTSSSEPDSVLTEFGSDRGSGHDVDIGMTSWPSPSPCKCRGTNDIVINIIGGGGGEGGEDQCRRRLPPIITKKEDFVTAGSPVRRLPAGVRLRVNSPRIGSRRGQGRRSVSSNSSSAASTRRSISESMAVVKASRDPRRDFRESMVEMIMENNIRASNDLEELLACYLSLNSDEYHELIINVFKQIWFDFIHLRLK